MYALILRPEARQDMDAACQWYDVRSPGLGHLLLLEIDKSLQLLCVTPEMHQMCFLNYRRSRLKRFPYSIIYRVKSQAIEVTAFIHDRQNPKIWQSRR